MTEHEGNNNLFSYVLDDREAQGLIPLFGLKAHIVFEVHAVFKADLDYLVFDLCLDDLGHIGAVQ